MAQTEQVSKQLLTDSNWINKIQNVMQENVMSLFEKFYNGAHDLVYSTASTTIIMLIVVYWLIRQIKTGYPTYDEIWKAGKYVLIVCGIFAVLTSFNVYTEFLHLLMIPENIITSVVSSIFQSQDFASIVTESANRVDNIRSLMWNYGVNWTLKSSQSSFLGFTFNDPVDYLVAYVGTFFVMLPFWIFYVVFYILLIGITIVIFFSKFMAFLLLSTLPLVLPFLIFTRFIPYLWSWYKLYLSYSIIAPLAFIALNLAMNPTIEMEKWANPNTIGDLFTKQFEYLITGTITCITAIVLLKRIPNWINSVLATQMESGAGGIAGGAIAGAIAGKTIAGGIASKAMGNSFIGGAMRAFGSATGGKAGAQIASSTGKAISNTAKDIASGTKALGNATAKAYQGFLQFRGGHAVP
ncbi:P-type type IV conjugative transfer system protein TrbL/VirB6 [Candidatus Campylobacter infans]|uniref:P-type type IV conjugative transfer system protein TrbL/VirB6 n=1 Tax=Candidatus Campylobacter infans TaxID=2561898 RepID=A0A7H9CPE5_9BACT|nr:type IV secretion system protein [Candidatus Campylobacter infans]QLI06124.1 P-type type IV conjugative transfer system protein TrbL/VirB6 [Candidatus Campylobacter infans]